MAVAIPAGVVLAGVGYAGVWFYDSANSVGLGDPPPAIIVIPLRDGHLCEQWNSSPSELRRAYATDRARATGRLVAQVRDEIERTCRARPELTIGAAATSPAPVPTPTSSR